MLAHSTYYIIIDSSVILFLLWCCLKEFFKNRKQKLIIQNLNMYNENLLTMYDGIRGFKHDFANFVQALSGYVKCDDMEGIKNMTSSLCLECSNIKNTEELNPQKINNPAVFNLLASKYAMAVEKNIEMNIEVEIDIQKIPINVYPLCRMLGILIDNAIEASNECNKKVVNIRFYQSNGFQRIKIENTYLNKNIDISEIFNKGYSTKEKSSSHGLGLWQVKKIVESLSNVELFTSNEELFEQELVIG